MNHWIDSKQNTSISFDIYYSLSYYDQKPKSLQQVRHHVENSRLQSFASSKLCRRILIRDSSTNRKLKNLTWQYRRISDYDISETAARNHHETQGRTNWNLLDFQIIQSSMHECQRILATGIRFAAHSDRHCAELLSKYVSPHAPNDHD
jgi:hypothetical protein